MDNAQRRWMGAEESETKCGAEDGCIQQEVVLEPRLEGPLSQANKGER